MRALFVCVYSLHRKILQLKIKLVFLIQNRTISIMEKHFDDIITG